MYFTIELDPTFKFLDLNDVEVEGIPVPNIVKQEFILPTVTYTITL